MPNRERFYRKKDNFLFIRDLKTITEIYETWDFLLEKHFGLMGHNKNLKLDWDRII